MIETDLIHGVFGLDGGLHPEQFLPLLLNNLLLLTFFLDCLLLLVDLLSQSLHALELFVNFIVKQIDLILFALYRFITLLDLGLQLHLLQLQIIDLAFQLCHLIL